MTARAPIRQADVKRLCAGAKAAGMRFVLEYDGARVVLRPVDGAPEEDEGEALRKRMDLAFGR
jgi:hypothetical protein